jgi:hypothetical protein
VLILQAFLGGIRKLARPSLVHSNRSHWRSATVQPRLLRLGQVVADQVVATAIVDRRIDKAIVINIAVAVTARGPV